MKVLSETDNGDGTVTIVREISPGHNVAGVYPKSKSKKKKAVLETLD